MVSDQPACVNARPPAPRERTHPTAGAEGYSPSLPSKLARSTADLSVEQIAAEIAEVARA